MLTSFPFGITTTAENRVIKTWGWGEHGQLGLGNTYDQISPQAVRLGHRLPGQHTMIKVYCGSGFTFAIKAVIPSQTWSHPHSQSCSCSSLSSRYDINWTILSSSIAVLKGKIKSSTLQSACKFGMAVILVSLRLPVASHNVHTLMGEL